MYYVYILWSPKIEKYYVGSTGNLADRLERHNGGRERYTRGGTPWELKYTEVYPTRSEAVKREMEIKGRKSKNFIEKLVSTMQNTQ